MFGAPANDTAILALAVIGGLHALVFALKITRFFAAELRQELQEWRKFFRGG